MKNAREPSDMQERNFAIVAQELIFFKSEALELGLDSFSSSKIPGVPLRKIMHYMRTTVLKNYEHCK